MTLDEINKELATRIGAGSFQVMPVGSGWVRVFILQQDKATIGRLSFSKGHLEFIKYYKDKLRGHGIPLDESDEIKWRFHWWLYTGQELTHAEYLNFVDKAGQFKKTRLEAALAHRTLLPTHRPDGKRISRHRITGPTIQECLDNIIREALQEKGVYQ